MNYFRYLDHKENLKREKTFYKKFTDRIMNKHITISKTIDKEREKEKIIQELRKKNEEMIKNHGSANIVNYVSSYYDMQRKTAKSRKEKHKIKSLTGTDEFELLKILPHIKDEKKENEA